MWQKLEWRNRQASVWLHEHQKFLKEGILEKLKFVEHAHENYHRVCRDGTGILEIDSNIRYRKYIPPSGSSLSAMRLPAHRDQYDMTDPS
jgi:hypothetical protein